jgi:Fe2+ transport system protein B
VKTALIIAGILNYHPRWVALKLIERDKEVLAELREADSNVAAELEALCEKTATHVRDTLNTDVRLSLILKGCLTNAF